MGIMVKNTTFYICSLFIVVSHSAYAQQETLEPPAEVELSISKIMPLSVNAGEVFTIRGNGFGSTQGESRVELSFVEEVEGEIKSWSHNKIEVYAPQFRDDGLMDVQVVIVNIVSDETGKEIK